MKYQTKHKKALIEYLKENSHRHLSINEIQEGMKHAIPVATLYRLIDSLVDEGLVRKYIIGPSSSCCYQYADCSKEHQHFHLICEKCGKLIHLECHEVEHLIQHVSDEHNFNIDVSRINLYGLCDKCQKEK